MIGSNSKKTITGDSGRLQLIGNTSTSLVRMGGKIRWEGW